MRRWEFTPTLLNGVPVPVILTVRIEFTLTTTCSQTDESLDWTGAYRPGKDVTAPRLVREVKPNYTAAAMWQRMQGDVKLEAVVLPDGRVGDVVVVCSLDRHYGLDAEAVRVVRQWRFKPGMREGEPVPVLIRVDMTFTLRK